MIRRFPPFLAGWLVVCVGCFALAADEPAADSGLKPGENHVGFRKSSFSYKAGDDDRERPILIWYPTAEKASRYDYRSQIGLVAPDSVALAGKHPLILFSHGFLGSADQTIFLMEALARRGYLVAGTNHADSLKARRDAPQARPMSRPNFADAKSWTDEKYRDRREDLVALLDHLLAENKNKNSFLYGRIDETKIGAAGHSLGGYTVLGLTGGWKSWREPRIQAVLALSPYSTPFVENGDLSGVKTPVMLQGGTLDWGITPFLPKVYEKLGAAKYYLVLKNETHFGWTNLISLGKTTTEAVESGNAQLMTYYSLAFFDRHLRGNEDVKLLAEKNQRVESFEFSAK